MDFSQPLGGLFPGARSAVLVALLRVGRPLTGRQVHALLSDQHSLGAVQDSLKALGQLGLVQTDQVGRAHLHSVNERHVAVAPLRELADPLGALRRAVSSVVDVAATVILFGSLARGESTAGSDIDLAVVAAEGWESAGELAEAVQRACGNSCDVIVFEEEDFERLRASREPVVLEIERDGIALVRATTRPQHGAA